MSGFFISLFFASIPIFWYIKAKTFTKKLEESALVNAILIDLKKIEEEDISYYEAIYEFIDDNGNTKRYLDKIERKRTVGKVYKMFFVQYKDGSFILVDKKVLKENKEGKAGFLLVFAGFVLLLGIISVLMEQSEELSNFFIYQIFGPFISVLFICIGIFNIYKSIKFKILMNDDFTRKIPAVITGYTKRLNDSDSGNKYLYFPIYKYELNGEIKTFESSYNSYKQKKGTKTFLYYNSKSFEVFEKCEQGNTLLFGLVFGVLGLIAFISCMMIYFT